MPYAIELFFDAALEQSVSRLTDALFSTFTAADMPYGSRPHITLAVVDTINTEHFRQALNTCFRHVVFPLALTQVDSFATPEGVIYLKPEPSPALLACHAAVHVELEKSGIETHPHYQAGHWVPHCTIAMGVAPAQIDAVTHHLRHAFSTLHGQVVSIGLVAFRPVKSLFNMPLHDNIYA